ncbi:putative membrane protein [Flavobacterium segetis]|uniref:Putative membrane protein n=1 Tax=Flavobacterium segetis TaxID=271157 RepID=A0A1M5FCI8_9FLAO|nr:carotenoid biosynthesis protein [Flavobacterium segetis]SHF88761.1 putative membrane protein [Flavobacterium segetis]
MIKNISVENRWIGLLLLFYFFGTLGISLDQYKNLFLPLTPFNLLLTLYIFYKVNNDYSKKFLILSVLIFLIGYSVEAVGVATGVLFGSYSYGNLFGIKVFETPLLIGVNWLFLSLSSYGVIQYFTKKPFFLIILPSMIMTGLDFFIEPVAMKLGFWGWENSVVPFQNYIMWFATSSLIHVLIYFFSPKINAKISFVVLLAQFVFFVSLYFLIT